MKPAQRQLARDDPMSCSTTNRMDYITHPITPHPPRPPTMYKRPEGLMSSHSEYRKEYPMKTPEPTKPIVPPSSQLRAANMPFDAKSTQMTDFIKLEWTPTKSYAEKRVYEPPAEAFDGISTIKSDYTGTPAQPAKSLRPAQEAQLSREPFNGTTLYRNCYQTFPIPKRFQRQKEVYQPSEAPLESLTTFSKDFPGHRGVTPRPALRPPKPSKSAHIPLETLTVNRQSFCQWELPPRISRPPTVYEPPKEKLEAMTTFKNDFAGRPATSQTSSFKPKLQYKKQSTPFEEKSVQKQDYPIWEGVERRLPIIHEKPYAPPEDKFIGLSTVSTDFKGRYTPPATSSRPPLKPYSKDTKFEAQTMYQDSYSQGGFKPDFITGDPKQPDIPGYVYSHEDPKTGHKFYLPVEEAQ